MQHRQALFEPRIIEKHPGDLLEEQFINAQGRTDVKSAFMAKIRNAKVQMISVDDSLGERWERSEAFQNIFKLPDVGKGAILRARKRRIGVSTVGYFYFSSCALLLSVVELCSSGARELFGTIRSKLAVLNYYEAGLYKKYGLSAEMLLISGGLTNIQSVMANEIGFLSRRRIATPSDRAGRRYSDFGHGVRADTLWHGVGRERRAPARISKVRYSWSRALGGIEETAARIALDRLGVGARNVLQAGPDPVRIAALESGSARATMLAPPGLFAATGRGLDSWPISAR